MRHASLAIGFALVTACASQSGTTQPSFAQLDSETLGVCREQFSGAEGWVRLRSANRRVSLLTKQYPLANGRTLDGEFIPRALWYRHSESGNFASCSKSGCGVDDCTWRVRTFSEVDGQWYRAVNHDVWIFYSQ